MRILLVGANGYIGSRLAVELSSDGHTIIGCDPSGASSVSPVETLYATPYQNLPESGLQGVGAILWFAGHSSVRLAEANRWASVENNVTELAAFFHRAATHGIPIIYASSASILSSATESYSLVADERRSNAYDSGKLAFDLLTPHLGCDCLGLRMATVSGWSPRMRWDLIFNAMNRSSVEERIVRVTNASSFRSLLFMEDLVIYIRSTLAAISSGTFRSGATHVALGSWSGTIGGLGAEISRAWGVPVVVGEDTGTYSFVINDRALRQAWDRGEEFYRSIRDRCAIFAQQNGWRSP
jgi:nucleoside-diphosphate-sugar epimerase